MYQGTGTPSLSHSCSDDSNILTSRMCLVTFYTNCSPHPSGNDEPTYMFFVLIHPTDWLFETQLEYPSSMRAFTVLACRISPPSSVCLILSETGFYYCTYHIVPEMCPCPLHSAFQLYLLTSLSRMHGTVTKASEELHKGWFYKWNLCFPET